MGARDNIATNSDKIAYTTYFPIDKVAHSQSDTFQVTNSAGTYNFVINPAVATNTYALNTLYPIGIYSTDGGSTWNDFTSIPTYGSLVKDINKPNVVVTPSVDSAGYTTYTVIVNSTVGGGSTFTLDVAIAYIIGDGESDLNLRNVENNDKITLSSISPDITPAKYRRIYKSGDYQVTSYVPTVHSEPHNLGFVPDLMVWCYGSSSSMTIKGFSVDVRYGTLLGNPCVYMDATNITFGDFLNGTNVAYYYRAYKT